MGETNGNHRSIFSMRSTASTTPLRVPRGRMGMAKSIAGFLVAVMAVAAMALASVAAPGLAQAQTNAPTDDDRAVLVAFYNATDGANWTNNDKWLSDVPIGQWYGVTTDSNGRVIHLILSYNQLTGGIPSELSNLANLEILDLSSNQLTGEIPDELGNLANLEWLGINENQLTGEIPGELSNLANLGNLYLSSNQLTGEIPSELSNLANLEDLSLSRNQLAGEIPDELGNLTNLGWLGLNENQLAGEIPAELGHLANLGSLALYSNQLTGEIPSELSNLANLYSLGLSGNQLTGPIPTWLGSLANLQQLELAENQLTGPIPSELGHLANLGSLWLSSNQLTGEIPGELSNLANLYSLWLSRNQLTGEIPGELANLTNLEDLYLSRNQLTGEIPAELGNLANLINLWLSGNQLSGCVPERLRNVQYNDFDELGLPFCAGSPPPTTDPCVEHLGTLTVTTERRESWASNCDSQVADRGHARYYTFTMGAESDVTITLESTDADTYLYLRAEEARSGDFLYENDDDGGTTKSQIQETLDAGTYTIEATTYAGGETGSFTLILSGLGAAAGPTPSVPALWFDTESQPFDDPRVRYAISYAIDQELINEIFWDGRGDLQSPVPDALFPQWTTELDDPGVLQEWHLYDPEESRRLLAEAGYPDGLKTRMHVLPRWVEWAEAIVAMLAEVDIIVDVVISDPASIAALGQVSHQNMIVAPLQRFGGDVAAFIREHFTDQGQHNYSRVASDVPEEILSEFVDTEDTEKRRELVYNLQYYLHDWWYLVPLPAPPTPPAPTDPCIEPLAGLVTIIWDWDEDACASEVPGRGYARYFSFTVPQASEVTITLESEVDTYLYLRAGQDRSGEPLHENDDLESGDTNSRITTTLAAGTYTVEATTYDPRRTGDFTLSFEGLGTIEPPPPPVSHPCVEGLGTLTGEVRRFSQWAGDCPSNNRNGSDARFYEFTLAQGGEVQIDLASETDTYLYLMRDFGKDGPVEAENDDVEPGNTNSRIAATLSAETYTIEATTYSAGETGSFTLEISGLGTATTTPPTSNDNDRDVLVALYNATGGANWTNNYNWLTNAPLGQWRGVITDASGRVTDLYLARNGLSGEIPDELGNLISLRYLYLGSNRLSGEIPDELGNLISLRYLYLGSNRLSGEIPAELGSLTNLESLDLGSNKLSGEIPAELGDLDNLVVLELSSNQLTGTIAPQLASLTNLQQLSLSNNQLSGPVPTWLGSLTKLERLYLPQNQLTGTIPPQLASLTNLQQLSLSNNQLTGTIPTELGSLANLESLVLWGNQLTGRIPAELGNLDNLEVLSLSGNELTGPIPTGLGSLANLEELLLSGNQLTGCIPAGIAGVANNDFNQLGLPFCAGALGSPTIGTLTPGADFLTITWAAPTGSTESAIIAYDLRYIETAVSGNSDADWTIVEDVWTADSGTLSYQIAGLINGTRYDVQVRAVTADGDGPWSATARGTSVTWGAVRSFSPPSVAPAGTLTVTITASGYGAFGAVRETLPVGFSYVSSSLDDDSVTVAGQEVRFTLSGESSFTYTAAAPNAAGTYRFSGVLRNSDRDDVSVGGPLTIEVTAVDPLIARYDANNNGTIEKGEVIKAINDYLLGAGDEAISKADVIQLINLYLFG